MRTIKFRSWDNRNKIMDIPNAIANDIDSDKYQIMQFTGLLDKNGKEIYEGDIATSEFGIGTIEYGKISKAPEFHFDTGHDDLWLWCCKNSTLEVIGNIYENPELLEGE